MAEVGSILEFVWRETRTWHILTVIGAFVLFALIHSLYIYPLFLSPLRKVPGPPYGHWLLGQLPNIINQTTEPGLIQREWIKQYGDSRGILRNIGAFGKERMMFLSTEAMHKILVSDWIDYPRPVFMRKLFTIITGHGLLTVTGDAHKQMRRFMNPAFSLGNLVAQTDLYYKPIYKLVEILQKSMNERNDAEKSETVLMYPWISKLTLDIICRTAFDYDTNSLENPENELALAYGDLVGLQSAANMALFTAILSIPGGRAFVQSEFSWKMRGLLNRIVFFRPLVTLIGAMRRIRALSAELLSQKMNEALFVSSDDRASKKDILSLLVRARANGEKSHSDAKTSDKGLENSSNGYRMSNEEMMGQVLTFLGAGHETTASGLSWTLWLLANHLPVQESLRKEVTALLEKSPTPDYRSLKDCQLLDCVVMESLRLYPPVPITLRRAAKSDWVDGVYVPKDTLLYIPIRASNTWKEVWGADAEEFRPDRWLHLPETYHSSLSLQTFIAGPHACIGRTMAIMEMKAVLAVLMSHFSVEPAHVGQVAKPTAAITMKPADGLPLKLKLVRPLEVAAM